MNDNLTRFSDRVENYLKFRPDYPAKVVTLAFGDASPKRDSVVVDLGSGTGKLAQRFLHSGFRTLCVEPNNEMREAAESLFRCTPGFVSVAGTAECTGLEDACCDLVVMGQALHWFDCDETRLECRRILKPNGRVAVVYNERSALSPLLRDYEAILHQHARDYAAVTHRNIDDAVFHRFFGSDSFRVDETENSQRFDFAGVLGRYSSSSYAFKAGDAEFPAAKEALRQLFLKYQDEGYVLFEYRTLVYSGKMQ